MRAAVFSITLLLSSFLLFLVQPMIGRMLLPSLGGTPAVWNGCVLFFQAVLLGGYAWAHYGPPKLGIRNHLLVHLGLLACVCLLLPMRLMDAWPVPTSGNPLGWLFGQLAFCVGIPFFVISSSAPLLQRWFSLGQTDGEQSEPWFLYAVSNVGSLGALLGYPFLVERAMGLDSQRWFWMGCFLVLATMFAVCAWMTLSVDRSSWAAMFEKKEKAKPILWSQRVQYIALAAIPSSLMLGVTTVVSTEVGSFPMMWSIPLALYLLTFVFVFASRQIIPHRLMLLVTPIAVLLLPILLRFLEGYGSLSMIAIHFSAFFLVAMACHGELARLKPDVSQLTEFFLLMSIGGVIGGAVNSLIAPVLFNGILEYPIMLAAACFVMPTLLTKKEQTESSAGPDWQRMWLTFGPLAVAALVSLIGSSIRYFGISSTLTGFALVFGIPSLCCLSLWGSSRSFAVGVLIIAILSPMMVKSNNVLYQERGFFGVNEVYISQGYRMLRNGTTLHGMQKDGEDEPLPLTYYHYNGPMGDVFRLYGNDQESIAAVGLGVGSLAAYSKPGQRFDFFEIDPVVVSIAENPRLFRYLDSATGDVNVVLGDARIQLEQIRNQVSGQARESKMVQVVFPPRPKVGVKPYGLLILDAFGSDAVPLHLLTAEAMQLYFDLLPEDGLLAMHVSSKYLDFMPVGAALAEATGTHAAIRKDKVSGRESKETGRFSCNWMIFSKDQGLIDQFVKEGTDWNLLESDRRLLWTDDHANIVDAINW